jgi:heme/copper-type cytochrome/quinol oxidase subunit 3
MPGFCKCYGEENLERIKKSGGSVLWTLTIAQGVYFIAYSLSFTIMYNTENGAVCLPAGHFLSAPDWYRWIAILILLIGTIFFLFKSIAVKKKNPNELFSYMTLVTLLNAFFIYKLIVDIFEINN